MKILPILKLMGRTGIKFRLSELEDIFYYIRRMLNDCRVVELCDNGVTHGYLFFSICDDIDAYYKKPTWKYVPQNPNGAILYIEKLVALSWNKDLRKLIQDKFEKNQNLGVAIWHRFARWGDRKVIYRRHVCTT